MNFADPENLIWIWLILPAGMLFYFGYRRRLTRRRRVAPAERDGSVASPYGKARLLLKGVLVVVALAMVVLALARPRLGYEWREVTRRGVDVMIVFDVSKSMLAEDVSPSRLERARREVIDLLEMLEGDRVGLVAFSGVAFVQCPLTTDYNALRMFLSYLDTELIPVQGTNLEDAIGLASTSLQESAPEGSEASAIILITDGEDRDGRGLAAAEKAAALGIKVFAVGVGSSEGVPIPEKGGGFLKDANGNVVISRLEESSLQQLAVASGGTYVRSVNSDMDLERIYRDGIKSRIQESEYQTTRERLWYERFQWFVLAAILALFFDGIILDLRRSGSILALLLCILSAAESRGDVLEEAHESYEQGQYDEAAKKFLEAEVAEPDAVEHAYNRAVSQYRAGDFDGAVQGFANAAKADDVALADKARFNLGNALAKADRLDEAAKTYEELLAKNPDSKPVAENLAWVKQLIEQRKQQQQQPNPDQQQKDGEEQDDQQNRRENENQQKDGSQGQQGEGQEERQPKPQDGANEKEEGQEDQQAGDQGKGREQEGESKQQDAAQAEQGQKSSEDTPEVADGNRQPSPEKNDQSPGSEALDKQQMSRAQAESLLRGVQDMQRKYLVTPQIDQEKMRQQREQNW